jgi:vanillate O-demethylase ferredoxin subunit
MSAVNIAVSPPRDDAADPPVRTGPPAEAPSAPAPAEAMELRVQSIGWLAESIRSFEFRAPDGTALPPFTAGAHIDVALPGDLSRSYSLINPPQPGDRYVVAVNRDRNSRGGSAYMCEALRAGDTLRVTAPRNNFPLAEYAALSVFVAGGIGITPILGMIGRLEELGRSWRLHYAVRNRAQAAFLDRLAEYEAAPPGRVHLHVDAEAGRLLDVAGIVKGEAHGTELYCCGPAPMIDAFVAASAGRDLDRIHIERFTGTGGKPTGTFTVVLARSKREFVIPAGETIMEVLMQAGIRVAHSCREGVCGTCETRVIEGVPDHKDNVLSARERASNKLIMICCSGARTNRLVLDL